VEARHSRLALAALLVLVLQVALGGWVTSNYAALACPDFPTCHGAWAPPMDVAQGFNFFQSVGPNYLGGIMDSEARIAIQIAHRLGAVAVLLVAGLLGWRLLAEKNPLGSWLVGALALQLSLGIANILLHLPLWVAVSHNAGGALLLLVLVTVNYRAFRGTAS
ncbi:MAG: COX15/CtaA family protein, partial [Gammaproteobacteria bacterium]|nr:COX15/CtaA family protein [Gammaproteobacteria bacterium]